MQFNPTDKETSLYEDALYWSGANSNSFPVDPDFTRAANLGLDRVHQLILRSDGRFQFDDENLSTELLDTTLTLTSGTQKYELGAAWLKIARVRVKEANGDWRTLKPVDRRSLSDSQLAASGTPWAYDKLGNFLYLVDTPNYTQANGIEVQYQREPDYFDPTDTTKEPGFASPFHRLISLYAALDYVESNTIPNRADVIRARIGRPPSPETNDPGSGMEMELCNFYASRDADMPVSLSLQHEDFGGSALGDGSGQNDNLPKGFYF